MIKLKCPHCQKEEQQVKAGLNASGSQRYKCKRCQRRYTPEPNELGYSEVVRRKALELYVDGANFRRIGRILDISRQTVANWVKAHAEKLPDEPPVPGPEVEVSELDEVFTFIEQKKIASTLLPK
ncbi:MAG: hypothetical protein DRP08_05480 [Candidatus Aenigmatarchaeota archaeon]|nr:MAG: hypothetical protein DRP08_05480 [Candidatus Aenigmarchaeota archaeon]